MERTHSRVSVFDAPFRARFVIHVKKCSYMHKTEMRIRPVRPSVRSRRPSTLDANLPLGFGPCIPPPMTRSIVRSRRGRRRRRDEGRDDRSRSFDESSVRVDSRAFVRRASSGVSSVVESTRSTRAGELISARVTSFIRSRSIDSTTEERWRDARR